MVSIKNGRETHRAANGGLGSADVTSNLNRRKSVSSSDREIGPPGLVEVELLNIVLADIFNTLMHGELVVNLLTILGCDELSFLTFVLGNLDLEVFADLTCGGIIKTVQELTDDAESFGDDTTYLTRVVPSFACLDGQVNDTNTTERGSEPELFVVESARVHAEHSIGFTNEGFSLLEESEKRWRS